MASSPPTQRLEMPALLRERLREHFEDKSVAEWIETGEDPEVIIQAAEDSATRLAA